MQSLLDRITEASQEALKTKSPLRPLLQLLLADVQAQAKSVKEEPNDIHALAALRRTSKKLREASEIAPLSELDTEFLWFVDYLKPKELDDIAIARLVTTIQADHAPTSIKEYIGYIQNEEIESGYTVDKKRAMVWIKSALAGALK